jgi:hypothetical protein
MTLDVQADGKVVALPRSFREAPNERNHTHPLETTPRRAMPRTWQRWSANQVTSGNSGSPPRRGRRPRPHGGGDEAVAADAGCPLVRLARRSLELAGPAGRLSADMVAIRDFVLAAGAHCRPGEGQVLNGCQYRRNRRHLYPGDGPTWARPLPPRSRRRPRSIRHLRT